MNIYSNIDANKNKTALFLGLFLVLVILLGWLISYGLGEPIILYIAVILAVGQAMIGYYSGDKIVLAISGAKEIGKKDSKELYNLVENLCITAGLPIPKIYIIVDSAPNAFATGRDPKHASIAVTTGLLERLNKQELEGVIAHELSHIGNYDIRLATLVVVLVGIISLISDLFIRFRFFGGSSRREGGQAQAIILVVAILAAILAPIAATLIQLAISRKREFLADSSGVLLTRYPEGLISALKKISEYKRPMRRVSGATAHLYIADPLGKKKSYLSRLFSTHPSVEERIKALTSKK